MINLRSVHLVFVGKAILLLGKLREFLKNKNFMVNLHKHINWVRTHLHKFC